MSAPLDVVRAVVDALNQEDWVAAARLCDPASLSVFKRQLLARVDPAREMVQIMTVEQAMRAYPDMPREAAEYQIAMSRRHFNAQSILGDEVPGVTSVEELQNMTPEQVFAIHLSANTLAHQLERARRHGHIPPEVEVQVRTVELPKASYLLLGSVEDGERVAHVVYRREWPQADEGADEAMADLTPAERQFGLDARRGNAEITTCRRQPDGTWRVIATFGFPRQDGVSWSYEEVQPEAPPED